MHKVKQMQSRKKNRGFSLLTVIVSVSFIGILVWDASNQKFQSYFTGTSSHRGAVQPRQR